jgi:ElaB/YqjD/DUF883 family membrane-anchored ribosome-binding protein
MSHDRFGYPPAQADGALHAAATGISEMAGTAGDQLADVAHQAQDVAKQQYDKLSDAIRAKPIQAAGIAVGVGFLLALLARR